MTYNLFIGFRSKEEPWICWKQFGDILSEINQNFGILDNLEKLHHDGTFHEHFQTQEKY